MVSIGGKGPEELLRPQSSFIIIVLLSEAYAISALTVI